MKKEQDESGDGKWRERRIVGEMTTQTINITGIWRLRKGKRGGGRKYSQLNIQTESALQKATYPRAFNKI